MKRSNRFSLAGIDLRSCCLAPSNMVLRRPFLQGQSDIDQPGKIFAAFGTPTTAQWQDMFFLQDYVEYQSVSAPSLRSLFPTDSDDTLDLLAKMFVYDPKNRITVQQGLDHRYFTSAPFPTVPEKLPRAATKQESKASGLEGLTVLFPPRKSRRVMPEPGGFEGNAHRNDQVNEVSPGETSRSGPMTLDFSVFAARTPNRPTMRSGGRSHLKRETGYRIPASRMIPSIFLRDFCTPLGHARCYFYLVKRPAQYEQPAESCVIISWATVRKQYTL